MVSSFPFFLLLDVLGNYADSLFVVSYITAPNRVIMLSFGTDEEYYLESFVNTVRRFIVVSQYNH